jgi:hypothetical protein
MPYRVRGIDATMVLRLRQGRQYLWSSGQDNGARSSVWPDASLRGPAEQPVPFNSVVLQDASEQATRHITPPCARSVVHRGPACLIESLAVIQSRPAARPAGLLTSADALLSHGSFASARGSILTEMTIYRGFIDPFANT